MAGKQWFKISSWDVDNNKAGSVTPFQAMINPTGYAIERTVSMSKRGKCDGRVGEALTLEDLVLDGTGVVPGPTGSAQSVEAQLDDLMAVVQIAPSGEKMVYPVVELVWGSLYYLGRVTSLTTKYTLFAPDGIPLRARVSMKIEEYIPDTDAVADSADAATMTKQLQVDAGMRLPELCFAAYGDAGMAAAVARFNGLTSMRNVAAGTSIDCP
ncbi:MULTISPECIES: hypothetical protein [Massilia]|uniref:Contractile injection system tube protein N-terminal domain-containing protein n=1 Tax=Massilia aurea TaxID=373040 RepID=A0A422QQQ6_9BURK|nr:MULTISPECIES: hypothetical protein [Massilia]MDY0961161.1 hypothetical protein [Massilia sp. CFBP9026]RNF32349.1 hypothetical protein NM04_02335 [Massilia aurea]